MSGRRRTRKSKKTSTVTTDQPQQPQQLPQEEDHEVQDLTVPPPPDVNGSDKGPTKEGQPTDKRKRSESHVDSEVAQEEGDSEHEAEAEARVIVTEKRRRKPKAPSIYLNPEQEEDISEWLKQNSWLWDRNEKDYRLRDTKQGGYNDKAGEMGLTAEELQRRIKTLKDIAVKALKPPPSGSGTKIRTPQQQRCVELFGFLAKKVVRRPGRSTLKGVQPRPLLQVQEEVQEDEEEEGTDEETQIEVAGDIPPPKPRRMDRRRQAVNKEHQDLLEAMRRSLAESSAINQRVETALRTAPPPPTDPRMLERHTYGHWFMSILPSIGEEHWYAFRRDINRIVDHFQAISVASQRPPAQSPYLGQSLQTGNSGAALFHGMDQAATQTTQQQQFFKPSTSQFVSTSTSSTSCEPLPDWQRQYQRPDQDFLFPEGQTTFSSAQVSYLPEPHQVTRIVRVQQVPHAQQQEQQLVAPGQLPQQTFGQLRPVRLPIATATPTTSAAPVLSSSPAVRRERSLSAPNMQASMESMNTPVFLGTPEPSPLSDPSPQSKEVGESFRSLLKDF